MRVVIAVIKPFKLDDVREAIAINGANGMTVIEAKGHGRQKGHKELYRGSEYAVDYLPKIIVASIVPENRVKQLIRDIKKAAHTGKIGDGIVMSFPLDVYERIRTDEQISDENY